MQLNYSIAMEELNKCSFFEILGIKYNGKEKVHSMMMSFGPKLSLPNKKISFYLTEINQVMEFSLWNIAISVNIFLKFTSAWCKIMETIWHKLCTLTRKMVPFLLLKSSNQDNILSNCISLELRNKIKRVLKMDYVDPLY